MYKRNLPNTVETEMSNKKAKKLVAWAKQFSRKNWYVPKKLTNDGFFTSYGPRHGILFVGMITPTISPKQKIYLIN